MDTSIYDDVWKLMSEYKFVPDTDSANEDFLCLICKNLMIDACQSLCGCLYCYKCIYAHQEEAGEKYCPGTKTGCREEYLCLKNDVLRNMRINGRISKLVVKCPNELCQSKIELVKMNEHLRVCTKQLSQCPFTTIGCNKGRIITDSMVNHMDQETVTHSQLLIEHLLNTRNEVTGMKDTFEKTKSEAASMKLESQMKDIRMEDQRKEIECIKRESKKKEKSTNDELKEIKNDIELRFSTIIGELERKRMQGNEYDIQSVGSDWDITKERFEKNIDYLTKNVNEIRMENKSMMTQIVDQCKQIKEIKDEKESLKLHVDNLEKILTNVKVDKYHGNDNEERSINRSEVSRPDIDVDYVWRINEWTKKKETMAWTPIFSEAFYSNKYKLCLRLYIDGDNIGLYCFIMRGENDDCLVWPMRRAVTLSIVDQATLRAHKSASFQYDYYGRERSAFNRPTSERNYYCIGAYPFILYSAIKNKPSIIVTDSIVVSCVLSDLR